MCLRHFRGTPATVIIGKMTFKFPIRADASLLVGVALLIGACSRPGSTAGSSELKPIDQAALQSLVDTTIKELLIPGAVVLLRTPQGDFTAASGSTQLNTKNPPRADTHFRIASNTKTMTATVIMQLAQESKLALNDPVSKVRPGRAQRRQHHHRAAVGNAQRSLQLHQRPHNLGDHRHRPSQGLDPRRVTGNCIRAPTKFPAGCSRYRATTPTMHFSVSPLKRSTASRWRRRCRTGCSARWDCNTPCSPPVA